MKHIKETPAPLPADLPPNVRELIEITLVKNPGMRYRTGGQFADAVAAVRAGRRPPRPNAAPTIGRATAVGDPRQLRRGSPRPLRTADPRRAPSPAATAPPPATAHLLLGTAGAAVGGRRARRPGHHHRDPDRAGRPQDRRNNKPVEPTVTDTVTPTAPVGAAGLDPRRPDRPDPIRTAATVRCIAHGDAPPTPHDAQNSRNDHPTAPVRPLRARRDPRLRRHVRGPPRARPAAAPRRGGQGAARRPGPRPQLLPPVPPGGAERRRAEPPGDRRGVRHRRGRDDDRPAALHRDGVRRRASRCATSCTPTARCRRSGPSRSSPTPARR